MQIPKCTWRALGWLLHTNSSFNPTIWSDARSRLIDLTECGSVCGPTAMSQYDAIIRKRLASLNTFVRQRMHRNSSQFTILLTTANSQTFAKLLLFVGVLSLCFIIVVVFVGKKLIWQNGNRARFFNPLKRCKLHVKKCRMKCLWVCRTKLVFFVQNICLTLTGFGWMLCTSPVTAGIRESTVDGAAKKTNWHARRTCAVIMLPIVLAHRICEYLALIWNH